jgi:hypothetical protein
MIHRDISFGYDYDVYNNILLPKNIISNYGLFSSFTLLLSSITHVHHNYNTTPNDIICHDFLLKFKERDDNTNLYKFLFKIDDSVIIDESMKILIGPNDHHLIYDNNKIKKLAPYFKKYFSLNDETNNTKIKIEQKYNIKHNNRISVIYRGSDKWTDMGGFTQVGPNAYIQLTDEIFNRDKSLKVLIQSDEKRLINFYNSKFNSVFIDETDIGEIGYNEDPTPKKDKKIWLRDYVSSIFIHGESKHLITYTGNSGFFSVLHRGNTENVHQEISFLKNYKEFFLNN